MAEAQAYHHLECLRIHRFFQLCTVSLSRLTLVMKARKTTKNALNLACCFTPFIQQHHLVLLLHHCSYLSYQLFSLPLLRLPMYIDLPPQEKKDMPKLTVGHAFLAAISSGLNVVVLVGPLPVITMPSKSHFCGDFHQVTRKRDYKSAGSLRSH